jgi:uncharacterized protein (UPF0210 family)
MNIRSVTAFADIADPIDEAFLAGLGQAAQACRGALIDADFGVQTTRLATQPFMDVLGSLDSQAVTSFARRMEAASRISHFDYISLGPVRLGDTAAAVDAIPKMLDETENVFVCVEVANKAIGLSLGRVQAAARTIQEVAHLRSDGFSNLRLAILANVEAWTPFFPAAYHGGGSPRIALAIEGADLAVAATRGAGTLGDARAALIHAIESHAEKLEAVVRKVLEHSDVTFQGIDFTLAPYPDDTRSIGVALEQLGLPAFGGAGSLVAAAFLTDALGRARFARTGLCGLMLPVLEDSRLARRAAEDALHVSDLLMCSAVCGTGLDTIPLPGDVSQGKLAAVLMDIGALALRLDKQLTARLMPLPGKHAGDPVSFDFDYFANSCVLDIDGDDAAGLLSQEEDVDIRPLPGFSQTSRS